MAKPIQLLTPHPIYTQLGIIDEERQSAYGVLFRGRMPERDLTAIRQATNKAWVLGSDRLGRRLKLKPGDGLRL
ncbi:hypothetical protein [uncultured Zhongshania sp.]|uniref:hypothetical protein n=1 Tax=uncultured Zhongshania sp. TaxID=1642288 RepID=UPI0030DAF297